uniref:G domain-containing protein n=1 Tax=Mesocestoides corti TaxID=53468 RepID=A0A0R3UDC6_MESCO
LERTFIRDPHAAIFDADLILVVVDASNKYSREALDPEVLKTLHFFSTKESVLVLNKVDKSKGNPTRLLEVTRRLTAGVVGGRTSHLDAFANKFNQRALLASNEAFLKHRPTIEAVIYPRLPAEAHEAAEKRLSEIKRLLAALPPPIQIDSGPRLPPPPSPPPPPTPPPTLLLREAQPELEHTSKILTLQLGFEGTIVGSGDTQVSRLDSRSRPIRWQEVLAVNVDRFAPHRHLRKSQTHRGAIVQPGGCPDDGDTGKRGSGRTPE